MKIFTNQYIQKTILLIGFLLAPLAIFSQNLFSMMPQAYNPAFVGAMNAPRLSVTNPFIAPLLGYERGISVKMVAYDQSIRIGNVFKLGVGARYGNEKNIRPDFAGADNIQYYSSPSYEFSRIDRIHNYGIAVAPKLSFRGKHTISLAAEVVAQKYVFNIYKTEYKWDGAPPVYYDSLPLFNYVLKSNEVIPHRKSNVLLKTGLLYNTEKGYIGIAYVTRDLFKECNIQLGRTFQRSEDSKFSFTPSATFLLLWDYKYASIKRQFRLSNLNLQFRWNKNYFGTNNRGLFYARQIHNCRVALSFTLPFEYKGPWFGEYRENTTYYNVDEWHSSRLELSARYIFKKKKKI